MATRDISDLQVVQAYAVAKMVRDELPPTADPSRFVWPYDLLHAWTGQPLKVCYAAMERADRRNFIEYGVSLRAGFLTPKGEALLEGRLRPDACAIGKGHGTGPGDGYAGSGWCARPRGHAGPCTPPAAQMTVEVP